MLEALIQALQTVNDPGRIVKYGLWYVTSYYVVSGFFHHYAKKTGYAGA